jgi:PAS domain S-box-containing protein
MPPPFFWSEDPSLPLIEGQYHFWLVLLSLIVSIIASNQALRLASLAREAVTPQLRLGAIAGGSLSLGAGIWAMHFIGMLAYTPHAGIEYDLNQTLLSILPALAASAVALMLLAKPRLCSMEVVAGGVIVGAGIAGMHYSGMSAMRMHAIVQYAPGEFALSVATGMALAMLALWIRFGLTRNGKPLSIKGKTLATLIMGSAIAGMHYTAMLALRVHEMPGMEPHSASTGNQPALALTIALTTLAVGGLIAQTNAHFHYRTRWQIEDMNAAHLRALVQMAADGIICIDPRGTVLNYNPAAEHILGWTPAEVIGQNVKMLVPEALSGQHDEYLRKHELAQSQGAEPLHNKVLEVLGQHRDGTLIPLRVALSQADAKGQRMYVGILTDLSSQKKTERQLRIATTVFEHSFEGVAVLDANRRVVDVNPAYERMSGLSRKAARNKEFSAFYLDTTDEMEACASFSDVWSEIARNGHWRGDWKLLHNGRRHQLSITAVHDEQQRLHHYICICCEEMQLEQPAPQLYSRHG